MMHENLWQAVYNELVEALPAHAINTWFEPVSPVALSEKELVLEVPNQFFYEWIESHYKQNLASALSKASKLNVDFKFIVSAKKTDLVESGDLTPKQPPISAFSAHYLNNNYQAHFCYNRQYNYLY